MPPLPIPSSQPPATLPDRSSAYVIYGLYLIAIVTGVPMFIGVIVAYLSRDGAPDLLRTHYRYQIRTFWLMWCYAAIVGLVALLFFPLFVIFGIHILWLIPIWVFLRCFVGLRALSNGMPVPRPATWLF